MDMQIPHSLAKILGSIAERCAAQIGVPMTIAIVDAAGSLQFYLRMDGALPASMELAVSKAYTASVLRMPTHQLGSLAGPGQELYGIDQTHQGRIILFGGGFPLRLRRKVAGGIGVSGGSVRQDMEVAAPVLERLAEMELWADRMGPLLPSSGARPAPWRCGLEDDLADLWRTSGCSPYFDFCSLLAGALILAVERCE